VTTGVVADYNYRLSKDSQHSSNNINYSMVFKNKIIILEGRGRVILSKNGLDNLDETRQKIDE
jgi:hypothetical protein